MVLVKPIAQRELHPQFKGYKLSRPQSESPQSLRAQWEGKANKMVQNGSKQSKETAGQGQFDVLDSLYKYEINLDQVQSIFSASQSDTNSHLFYYLPSPEQ